MARSSTDRRAGALGDFDALPDELLCSVLGLLEPRDIGAMACVSSVFYVLCNEEPLWMRICLSNRERVDSLVYKGSWKRTAMKNKTGKLNGKIEQLQFNGFTSLYLYRRWYRCHMSLENFFYDAGAIERRKELSYDVFVQNYDVQKPVLLTDLAEDWPARRTWTIDQLVHRYGDSEFKVSQSYGQRIRMTLKDYADYTRSQHDEDPLYIFDSSFGESTPGLLEDYTVPYLFKEDLFSVLSPSQRPPYRWLVIGPSRSGANWHVDPALTSAWNALLSGRKRWAFYPPGRVPPGVFVDVNEDDGEIHYDGPTSLQWWMDVYPSLDNDSKPLECTQHPGETIFVPSGWWHCVLNIDETVAVTQNFVNSRNMELVCIDMAPGFHHRGVARAGLLALDDDEFEGEHDFTNPEFLKKHIGPHPDHFLSETSADGMLNKRDFRDWLRKLQVERPDLRHQIWKCACLAIDADTWQRRLSSICNAHDFYFKEDQHIPVGHGSSPVYLLDEYAIKIYIHEDGIVTALQEIDHELQFYALLRESASPLAEHVPAVIAKGIVYEEGELFRAVPSVDSGEILSTGMSMVSSKDSRAFWPYIVTRRCPGQNLAHCRGMMKDDDYIDLASFLGCQLRHLHTLSLPMKEEPVLGMPDVPQEWTHFVSMLRQHRQTLAKRLKEWGSVPRHLLEKVEDYVPKDPVVLIGVAKVENGAAVPSRSAAWLHMDIMEDNIQMVPHASLDGFQNDRRAMQARYIFDFGDLRRGDPLYELVPLFTDVLEANVELLEHFLESYKLDLAVEGVRTSYRAMCYCLLYKYDAMEAIFRGSKELRMVESWHELELILWGMLNE
ncbi:F-box protein At1g78280 isoform X2 [Selaginella moellendorffii]|uniref:F-box protein At1g78280 isoform X2 n=1 Tax=Selaginella moellendorffii TaxID=88036 RepID=UPI000D1CAEC8|nr:F-box protein At1g78280 isoform X2 [Selaginella moellendorffii]|eukprot:XP_024543827.1 F-box protein At1g78280 isoform X2 [Selaginella moellendorffii]